MLFFYFEDTNYTKLDCDVDYDEAYDKIKAELNKMFWYDINNLLERSG